MKFVEMVYLYTLGSGKTKATLTGMDSNPSIRDLYPTLNEAQLKEAEENLDRYLALSIRMYERIRNDPVEYARFKKLTTKAEDLKIEGDKF